MPRHCFFRHHLFRSTSSTCSCSQEHGNVNSCAGLHEVFFFLPFVLTFFPPLLWFSYLESASAPRVMNKHKAPAAGSPSLRREFPLAAWNKTKGRNSRDAEADLASPCLSQLPVSIPGWDKVRASPGRPGGSFPQRDGPAPLSSEGPLDQPPAHYTTRGAPTFCSKTEVNSLQVIASVAVSDTRLRALPVPKHSVWAKSRPKSGPAAPPCPQPGTPAAPAATKGLLPEPLPLQKAPSKAPGPVQTHFRH